MKKKLNCASLAEKNGPLIKILYQNWSHLCPS